MSTVLAGVLGVALVLGCGVVAGVLFAVALSTVPALEAMPPDRYVYAHQLLGRNWDPTMPVIVLGSTLLAIVLAFVSGDPTGRVLFAGAAVLLLGVSVVSHWGNVPINRHLRAIDPDDMPADWHDPRPVWRRRHLLRTALALVALVVAATGVASA